MHMSQAVDVVIPARNAAETIARAIASIAYGDTRQINHVFVVDDGSNDDTANIASGASTAGFTVNVLHSGGQGSGAARNKGIEAASAPLIAFLDADDVWYPTKLHRQLPLAAPGVAIVAGLAHYVTPNGRILGQPDRYVHSETATADLAAARTMPFPISTMIMRREDLVAVGGFDPTFRTSQDLELAARIARLGTIQWPAGAPIAAYILNPESKTASAYIEQSLAADLIRLRASKDWDLDDLPSYSEYIELSGPAGSRHRQVLAGSQYRNAAVAVSEGKLSRSVGHMILALALDPIGTTHKLVWQRALKPRGSLAQVPPEALELLSA